MANKISKEHLEKLQDQVKKLNAIKHDLGVLEMQKHNLLHAAAQIQDEQEKLKIELEDLHGKISVNLEDGSFEAIVEEAEVVEG